MTVSRPPADVPAPPSPPPGPTLNATPAQLRWLREQVPAWVGAGIIDAPTAQALIGAYRPVRSHGVQRVFLALGGAFLGVGLIWLVASNLDAVSPGLRFGLLLGLWLLVLAASELLEQRSAPEALVGSLRTVVALGSGAVIFQAAQSLQVPAWEPRLIGCWALAAGTLAGVRAARGPLTVAIGCAIGWLLWEVGADGDLTLLGGTLTGSAVALLCIAMAQVPGRVGRHLASTWRHVAAAAALVTLFVAGVPTGTIERHVPWGILVLVALAVAAAVAALGVVRRDPVARIEVLVAGGVLLVGALLGSWASSQNPDDVGFGDVARALIAIGCYLGLAIGVAIVGALGDSPLMTGLSTVALVVFTVFQAFAVFAPIVNGALLFLLLGAVLLGAGVGFDRLRRRVAREVREDLRNLPPGRVANDTEGQGSDPEQADETREEGR